MTRSFVADDHPVCLKCGSPAHRTSRGADGGTARERQQFECAKCNVAIEPSATLLPHVDPMREPAVQGWLNGGLVAPD